MSNYYMKNLLESMNYPLAISPIAGDVMYLHQALKQSDGAEHIKAMVKDKERKHWEIVNVLDLLKIPKHRTRSDENWEVTVTHQK